MYIFCMVRRMQCCNHTAGQATYHKVAVSDSMVFNRGAINHTQAIRQNNVVYFDIHTYQNFDFQCAVCGIKFTQPANLGPPHLIHICYNSDFQCAVCGNKFTQPANLRTHVKKKHNYNFEANKNNKCKNLQYALFSYTLYKVTIYQTQAMNSVHQHCAVG